MKKNTRFAFNAYLQQLARLNGVAVEELSSKFTVEPSVQQTLEDQIQQSAAFLTLINVTPVTEQSGQLLGLGVGSTIAGTTDTTAKEREPVDPTLMVDVEYKCEQTNFDTVLTYAKLDLCPGFHLIRYVHPDARNKTDQGHNNGRRWRRGRLQGYIQ